MIYGNLPTGSFGYHDITILMMNRKPNADRKGPMIPIAVFAVAGSRSAITSPSMQSETALCELSDLEAVSVLIVVALARPTVTSK